MVMSHDRLITNFTRSACQQGSLFQFSPSDTQLCVGPLFPYRFSAKAASKCCMVWLVVLISLFHWWHARSAVAAQVDHITRPGANSLARYC